MLRWLLAAQGFEQFLSRKFPASKRFGLEGCEALLPGLLALVEAAAESGVRKVRTPVSCCVCPASALWFCTTPSRTLPRTPAHDKTGRRLGKAYMQTAGNAIG